MFVFSGEYATLDFTINNMEPFVGFQFDLSLPAPLSFVPDSAFLSERKANHNISANMINSNTLRVVSYSIDNQIFSGNDGKILELGFNAEGVGGYYGIYLNNVIIGDSMGINIVSAYTNGNIQIAAADINAINYIDFGDVSILDTLTKSLTINNYGNDTLEIGSIKFSNSSFSSSQILPLNINPGNSFSIDVSFNHATESAVSGKMDIFSNDPDENPFTIDLSGNAFIPNYISVNDSIYNYGDTMFVNINVDNLEPFTGFQFDLHFTDSLSCLLDLIQLSQRANDHLFHASEINSNSIRLIAYSMSQANFSGSSGAIISIPFVGDSAVYGSIPLKIDNAILGNSQSQNILWGINDGNITIFKPQEIVLSPGWNIMSCNAEPTYMNMDSILAPQMCSSNLIKIINESGGFIQYIPNVGWLNTIGNMAATEGYYIKVQNIDTININGYILSNPYTIPLQQGWNIMGYPQYNADNALSAFQPLISAGTLIKVIDESGGFIQYIPGIGWLDYINILESGEGYYIKVSQNTNLTLSEPSQKSINISHATEFPPTKHFISNIDSPFSPMHFVLLVKNQNGTITPGDEIAIFDGNKCVGSAMITENNLNPIVIITKNDDPTTEEFDGFVEGNSFKIKFWNKEEGVEYQYVNTNTISGDKDFKPLSTYIGEIDMQTFGISSFIDTDSQAFIINNYPNPFNHKTHISYWISDKATVKISLFNSNGKKIKEFFNQYQEQGIYNIEINGSTLKPGIYLCKITVNGRDFKLEKIIKMIKW